ncbi:Arm DNA-binding domain-containing protein [Bradyrhizobium sp. CCBAU 11386]|uniref:Arm DNA-binding domain-containing protein n=1 Tax=Bradyrhizobium sp. CCBAU 11386 TaxID=1630837 RepID=UPI002FDF906B
MPLTDTACRSAKPKTNAYKVSDGGGLHMLVETNGSRLWRQAYRFDGKQKLIALGAYPMSLAEPRNARDANKALLAKGVDPSAQRKLDRTAARLARTNTFRIIADELVAKFEVEGDDPKTLKKKK